MARNLYSDEEIEIIKKLYPDHFDYEIAEVLQRPIKSISGKICSLGLTGRIPASTIHKYRKWKEYQDKYGIPIKDLLYELHWTMGLPIRNGMDKELETNPTSVTDWMKELDIPHRSISEDNKRRYSIMTEEQIKAQTLAANEAVRANGQPNNIGRPGWATGLTKNDHPGLLISSEKHIGNNNPMWGKYRENHHGWKGKDKYWKYQDWYNIREKIKMRDNYTCRECNLTEKDSLKRHKAPLQVHHIIPYKFCKKHSPNNLITLCISCHSKADNKLNWGEGWKLKKLLESGDANLKQSIISQF